jgi:spore coat polysaccharide biosynthesis protein SpsF
MTFGIIIQARTGSKRFPKKILAKINNNKSILEYQISRILKVFTEKNIFLATTKLKEDRVISQIAKKYKIKVFQGSQNNLLKRYLDCAKKYKIKNIIRITSDCPLVDPNLIKKMLNIFCKKKLDYLSNTLPIQKSTYPDGSDIEIFTYKSLIKANSLKANSLEKEHVTNFFWKKKNMFKSGIEKTRQDLSKYKFSIDYRDELNLVKKIIIFLKKNKLNGTAKEIVDIIKKDNFMNKLSKINKLKFLDNRKDLS